MELVAARKPTNRRKKKIPSHLIYEIMNGKPLYRKGYKKALLNNNNFNEIGSSSLQAVIINCILEIIYGFRNKQKHWVLTNESGLHININNNLCGDILIFEKSKLTPDKINTKYIDIPALVQIEVDISADLEDLDDLQYITKKIDKLLDFGTQKIIWIFSASKRVIIATPGKGWLTEQWDTDIEIMDGHSFNIGKYLKEEGIKLDEI